MQKGMGYMMKFLTGYHWYSSSPTHAFQLGTLGKSRCDAGVLILVRFIL